MWRSFKDCNAMKRNRGLVHVLIWEKRDVAVAICGIYHSNHNQPGYTLLLEKVSVHHASLVKRGGKQRLYTPSVDLAQGMPNLCATCKSR